MNISYKTLNQREQFQSPESVPGTKIREYLIKRNMFFEEKRTGKTTTIIIKNKRNV